MSLIPGSSESALISLINQANALATPLVEGDLYYGIPRSLNDGQGTVRLPTVTMFDSEYEGYATFEYKRLNLNKLYSGLKPKIASLGQPTLHRLLPSLNKALGLNLTPRDVNDTQLNWVGGNEQANIQITATAASLGYEGVLVVQYTRVRPTLALVVKDKQLLQLRHPQDNPVKRSVDMMTWGMDFTDDRPNMQVQYTYWWKDQAAVNAIMAERGFANWPNPILRHIYTAATKDVPSANQAFQYVIIQESVEGPDYAGTAYIHFNQ